MLLCLAFADGILLLGSTFLLRSFFCRSVTPLQLLQVFQFPFFKEVGNTPKVLFDPTVPEFIQLIHKPLQEAPVMGYNNQRAIELTESFFEDVLGADIHMVGRFIQRQHIIRLEHQLGHAEPGPLPPGQDRDLLVNVFSFEEKRPQDIPEPCPDVACRNPVQGTEHRFVLVQDILLVLGVIADMDIVSDAGLAGNGSQLPCHDAHQGGFSLAVPADEGHFLPALDFDTRMGEHDFPGIADRQVLSFEDHVTGSFRRRKPQADLCPVRLIDFNAVEPLQRLNTGLDLVGFGRFITETVDEIFCLLNHPLLVLIGGRLLRNPFGSQCNILTVRDFIIMDMSQQDFYRPRSHGIQELSVMGDQEQRTAITLQIILEPLDGFDVQMVSRFVQQQYVRTGKEHLGQFDTHVPSLAERFRAAFQFFRLESKPGKRPLRLDPGRFPALQRKTVIDLVQSRNQTGIII